MSADRLLDRVVITTGGPDDTAFLHATWTEGYRRGNRECKRMARAAFFPWHRAQRDAILARPDTLVLVARGRARALWIAGYGVFERVGGDFVVHWVYARHPHCMGQGLAGRLLFEALQSIGHGARRLVASHRTDDTAAKVREMGFEYVPVDELYGEQRGAA